MPWIADGVTRVESYVLGTIDSIAMIDPELGNILATYEWFTAGLNDDEWASVIEPLFQIVLRDSEFARRVAASPWVADGVNGGEMCLLGSIDTIFDNDPEKSNLLVDLPQGIGNLTADKGQYCRLVNLALDDFPLALEVADYTKAYTGDLNSYILDSLTRLAMTSPTVLHQLTGQPWFADGLDNQEAAFVTTLGDTVQASPELYNDLLRAHFAKSRSVSLPLAGDVRIWAFQNTPFPQGEDLLIIMEDTARLTEEFMGAPFPTTDIILLVVDPGETGYAVQGQHYGSHMLLRRFLGEVDSIPHETAHYYFSFKPDWLREGAAQFAEAYLNHRHRVQTLTDRKTAVSRFCSEYENIRHLTYSVEQGDNVLEECHYPMGEHFLLSVFETIGEEATASALRELYLFSREGQRPEEYGLRVTEESIYHTFLNHTPPGLKEQFRNLYRRLHGGPYAYEDVDFADDHGDEAAAAADLIVGEAVTGTLDYMFDFDYFRFQAEEGRKYRMNVEHETLRASSVTLYAADGRTSEAGNWKSRMRAPSGPQILWAAPSSGEYYLAVQNFGGESGAYTLMVTPVATVADDHGDSAAAATDISTDEAVAGAVDSEFDLDYFRFQAEDGQSFRIEVTNGTLESFRIELYMSDGVTPAMMDYDDIVGLVGRGGVWFDIVDLKNLVWGEGGASFEWVAPVTGEYYIVVSGAGESVGAYTLTARRAHND